MSAAQTFLKIFVADLDRSAAFYAEGWASWPADGFAPKPLTS
jgi:hypothetical protein